MNYLEESLNFIESKEMRDYLQEDFKAILNRADNKWSGRYHCTKIVSYAPASLEKRYLCWI